MELQIGWPEGIWLALTMLGLGISMANHGQSKQPGQHNAWSTVIATVVSAALLYWGGFFS